MSVTCTHEAPGVCPACADRAHRAGIEWNHAEVWRMLEEMADSAFHDGKLPVSDLGALVNIRSECRYRIHGHEYIAQRIEQGA